MAIVSRFAPSPTGRLHLGHAYSAVRAHDLARAAGGRFLLRIEDIDATRSRESFVAGIEEDLRWLGLAWDGPVVRQSARLPLYAAALERLKTMGLVYPCFCTRAEIAASATAPHGSDGPAYPGTCRALSPDEHAARADAPHAWRLDLSAALARVDRPLTWRDTAAGTVMADPAAQGDVVLARKDAPTSYHFAVTIDDAAQGVTDVVRGADLFEATHVHRLLQALLGLPTPIYHHHPLLTGTDGRRLAKRDGAPALAELRAGGADPVALVAALRAGTLPIGAGIAAA
ncbi:tRNA glutamyl-Q(34) synthetase GluQRS [Sphingomonas nostoxanthinifaciens]|uniref:tRNA glutamyl-Q(34) synthetase GluQRS n=1 Tax=Sphingomonas nostoxanthinifaciens TaxID=2872652 RepID=UPI001CC1D8C2|nr:tRNA glutamyl-Q(34) synthetase GluQRS [Sphingomonas nostoxanthinifaciens]UAK24869.1 tRNA glutamyl-Q(34) synthetase GluQRS [Sphingomonas nostoxanthinifaciens]